MDLNRTIFSVAVVLTTILTVNVAKAQGDVAPSFKASIGQSLLLELFAKSEPTSAVAVLSGNKLILTVHLKSGETLVFEGPARRISGAGCNMTYEATVIRDIDHLPAKLNVTYVSDESVSRNCEPEPAKMISLNAFDLDQAGYAKAHRASSTIFAQKTIE